MKNLFLAGAVSLSLVAAACSAGDDQAPGNDATQSGEPGGGTGSDTSPNQPAPGGSSGTGSPTPGGGTGGGQDAGAGDASAPDAADGAAPGANAFTGAAAYAAKTGPSTRNGDHPNGGNPAKLDCMTSSCHGQGGEGPRFVAGGTIYTSAAATTPAAQVEVRLLDAKGNAVSAYTNADGNFFVRQNQGAKLAFPLKVGARNATVTRPMSAAIADGACSTAACHGGAATGVAHVP